ncbi:MAG: cytochrome c oxidase assembly factor Coa1 family protein [Myxococcaceae bacterium]
MPGWLKALVAVPLLCITCSAGGFFFMRSESPYDAAVERASTDPKVQEALGAPISASPFFGGKASGSGVFAGDGKAVMEIELTGTKQTGVIALQAVKTSGVWGFSHLEVHTADGKTIDLSHHSR